MTIKELQLIMERAKVEAEMVNKRKLNEIRKEVYKLNKEVGFYGIAGLGFAQFRREMKKYSYEDQMKLAYAFFQHIKTLDNIVFDEEEENDI